MDFDQLTTFVYVAKLKSFSRAGQKVFRSQSAVSAQIRQLEQAYRAKLLDRSAKSVELTPAGEVLFEKMGELAGGAGIVRAIDVNVGGRLQFFEAARPDGACDPPSDCLIEDLKAAVSKESRGSDSV